MRLTDFCHLNDNAYTRTSCVPDSLRGFHRVDTPRSLGLRVVYRGTECFTAPENASADHSWTRLALPLERFRLATRTLSSVGVVSPRRPLLIEPLTPLSPLPFPRNPEAPSRDLRSVGSCEPYCFSVGGSRQGRRDHHSVKSDGS